MNSIFHLLREPFIGKVSKTFKIVIDILSYFKFKTTTLLIKSYWLEIRAQDVALPVTDNNNNNLHLYGAFQDTQGRNGAKGDIS